ncbi:glycosyltransferase [Paracnuella aquatica]|nr:glycosyltransferase [Paracnuella aquatica]
MIRICSTLSEAGHDVLLVGRQYRDSPALVGQPFRQKRLSLIFRKGFFFYLEYNFRLLIFLLAQRANLICAIDLDTIIPVLIASKIKRTKRVYDAHELFCEMKEVVTRPLVYKIWKWIERFAVPRCRHGYTVNEPIKKIFLSEYKVNYGVIRNIPKLTNDPVADIVQERFIIYQGAVNEGRSFETLIPAFKWIDCPLHIYGDGNYLGAAKAITKQNGLENKVHFKGKKIPADLRVLTPKAILGITLFENNGLSNYYSLANRFFDYIHAGVPQLCVDYPVYHDINQQFEVAVLIRDLAPINIAEKINGFLRDQALQNRLRANCLKARQELNWQEEEKKLLHFYQQLLG